MFVSEGLIGFNDSPQVSFHQVTHYIYVLKVFPRFRFQNGPNTQNIFMLKQSLYFKFSESPLHENFMFESPLYLLDGY